MKKKHLKLVLFLVLVIFAFWIFKNFNLNPYKKVGQVVDSFNGINVYYNGGVGNVVERNLTLDEYNLGYKYQCVEFVKRYYYERFNHKMPDSYGNAKDFFDKNVGDGEINKDRGLVQYKNRSKAKPKVDDIIIFKGSILNFYGHVAIISEVGDDYIEIIQQNPGPFGKSRKRFLIKQEDSKWFIDNNKVLGWLRKE